MKNFSCVCGRPIFFENIECTNCGRTLGFDPHELTLLAFEPLPDDFWNPQHDSRTKYRKCLNYSQEHVCNWMVPADDPAPFCKACRLNDTIPDLQIAQNRIYWARLELAKRRLIYTLIQLQLPIDPKPESPELGLTFRFLADSSVDETKQEKVLTGHENGTITINLAEADDVKREEMRTLMREPYRTLLGHFRHEIGHYYWMLFAQDQNWVGQFRTLFGDERQDYSNALAEHYDRKQEWSGPFISEYASAHPWEDWAETWAHYMHIFDALETAADCGISLPHGPMIFGPEEREFDTFTRNWTQLTLIMNSLNRSMGLQDAYPYILSPIINSKLRFIHSTISTRSRDRVKKRADLMTVSGDS